jgi:dipeptidyl aminopeptidase/acylaminoacyl peptidase
MWKRFNHHCWYVFWAPPCVIQLLQGKWDQIVPKEQSQQIYDAITKNGGTVEYKIYPNEGHHFLVEETMKDTLEREIMFYMKCFKIGL